MDQGAGITISRARSQYCHYGGVGGVGVSSGFCLLFNTVQILSSNLQIQ
jgi:hypothetical protein